MNWARKMPGPLIVVMSQNTKFLFPAQTRDFPQRRKEFPAKTRNFPKGAKISRKAAVEQRRKENYSLNTSEVLYTGNVGEKNINICGFSYELLLLKNLLCNMTENEIASLVVDLSLKIHKQYGPGLFESIYESILCLELDKLHIAYKRQASIRVYHDGVDIGIGFIPDLVIEEKLIVELKSVEKLAEVHHKQILSYLKLMNLKLGLLINFNVPLIKDGIFRKANRL
jgi:GxxExxY protein